jgi:acetyltransferase-like isoleucine patch superfamily enzyme
MVLRAVTAINERFDSHLPPLAMFEHRTVASLCAVWEGAEQTGAPDSSPQVSEAAQHRQHPKVKLDPVVAVVAQRGGPSAHVHPGRPYRMRESWICKWLLASLYRFGSGRVRSLVQLIILKLEGGDYFTVTLRKLYRALYDLHIGDYTAGCFDVNRMQTKTKIGRYTSMFPTVVIRNADHPRNTISTNALFYHPAFKFAKGYELPRMDVEIGNDVFVGHNATILYPARRIGDGAVIAAGAVVIEDVPPYAIVGGYPAKVLRYRFSKEKIEELLESRWWEAALEDLEAVKEEFTRPLEGDRIR